jgi:HEPN domain-containing protein
MLLIKEQALRARSEACDTKMKRTTLNLLRGAEYDIQTAEGLLKSRRYIYVIFLCHLSAEKMLKAIVAESSPSLPPRTHNLYHLLTMARINLPEAHKDIVAKLNTMSIATRYPEDLAALSRAVTRKVAREYLAKTKEFLQWLNRDVRLSPSSDAT